MIMIMMTVVPALLWEQQLRLPQQRQVLRPPQLGWTAFCRLTQAGLPHGR